MKPFPPLIVLAGILSLSQVARSEEVPEGAVELRGEAEAMRKALEGGKAVDPAAWIKR